MFGNNPFAPAMQSLPSGFMEWYLGLMVAAVVAGVVFDITHKASAKYFFANMKKSRAKGKREVGGGELLSIAAKTAVVDVLASGEFCNTRRRIAHLLTMYGFLVYVATTAIMVFSYPGAPAPIVPCLLYTSDAADE